MISVAVAFEFNGAKLFVEFLLWFAQKVALFELDAMEPCILFEGGGVVSVHFVIVVLVDVNMGCKFTVSLPTKGGISWIDSRLERDIIWLM